ncbi:MAG: hypothetical protein J6R73_08310, partial [Alistipes sp.]|nr:hypothetical protein [Alistipes sp.]
LIIGANNLYLCYNNCSPNYANVNNNTRYLQVLKFSTSTSVTTLPHSAKNLQLYVVNPTTAAVTPMTEQLRNQHVKVAVNAYYNEQLGTFRFEATPWTEKNEEVEFN